MKGELSQMIWMTAAINGYLASRLDPNEFFPNHPTFHHCQDVQFIHDRGWLGGKKIAEEPRTWLKYLRDHRATRAFLHHASAPAVPGTSHPVESPGGGAGHWSILVDFPGEREHWTAKWSTHRERIDGKIWSVEYHMTHRGSDADRIAPPNLDADIRELESSLVSARQFSSEIRHPHWAGIFQSALTTLIGPATFPDYVQPICLPDFPEPAQRLLAACYHAWVFSGMGSWNDLVLEDAGQNKTHQALSRLLYASVVKSIQNSVNSFQLRAPDMV